jgi:hypothetical protein
VRGEPEVSRQLARIPKIPTMNQDISMSSHPSFQDPSACGPAENEAADPGTVPLDTALVEPVDPVFAALQDPSASADIQDPQEELARATAEAAPDHEDELLVAEQDPSACTPPH